MKKFGFLEYTMIVLFTLGLSILVYALIKINARDNDKGLSDRVQRACVESKKMKVDDSYLQGIWPKGQEVTVHLGGTRCNNFQEGDVVLFQISSELDPVLRVVRGLPGDRFSVTRDSKLKRWTIKINNKLVTINGRPYGIGHMKAEPPLKKHEIEFGGIIPEDLFIMLSQIAPGSQDSGTFGLVSLDAAIGKVVP